MMISFFKEGMKLTLTPKGIEQLNFDTSVDGFDVIVIEDWNNSNHLDGKIKSLRSERTYTGYMHNSWFNHYGKTVNNEVYQLVENNAIKSFQATLDDGRIINISCLN